MRLTRLKIIRHRWCAPTELILGAKRQLVLGKNGTGKTRLLELIARVCAGDLPWLMAEPIEFEAEWSVEETSPGLLVGAVKGVLRLTFSCEHRPMQRIPSAAPLVGNARSPGPKVQFRLTFKANPESILNDLDWQCSHGQVTASNGVEGLLDVVTNPTIWDNTIGRYPSQMLGGKLELEREEFFKYSMLLRVYACRRFDEAEGQLQALLSSEIKAVEVAPEGKPKSTLVWWGSPNLQWFIGEVPSQSLGKSDLVLPAEQVSFLVSLARITGYLAQDVLFRFVRSQLENGKKQFIYNEPRIYFRLPKDGDTISDKDLSFGEKRALSFLAYLNSGTGNQIIIADELMNGLHHSLGVALLNEIGDRQAFLATHEPVLMDEVDFESADELRRSLLLCRRNPDPKGPPFVWTQLSPEAAADVFPYYPKSLMQGSQILKHWELW